MVPAARGLAEFAPLEAGKPSKVLDIAASHGMYGIAVAQRNPEARLVALDWAPVLQVATENARAAGLGDRFSTIAGSAFEVDLGHDYDLVLVPNFLHHFPEPECVRFLRRVHAALRDGGRVAIVEFVPNPDRVSPPPSAAFSLTMLATTPSGDAYTFAELSAMLDEAGFRPPTAHQLPMGPGTAVIAMK
jgi:cyclopropane fatty-acyl-phospholipid synthase-like methyltransferase